MNRLWSVVVLSFAVTVALGPASVALETHEAHKAQETHKAQDADVKELVRLEEQFAEAGTRRDIAFLQRFLADDFVGHGVRGEALMKADVVGRFQLPGYGVTSIRHEDIRVRVFGNCAVASARSVIAGTYEGRDVGGQFHYLHVLVKRNGQWQVVAAHSTPLAGAGQ